MRRVLILALAAAAVGLAVGNPSRAAAFNPDPVFPVGPISDTASHQIAKLDSVASSLAGRDSIVNCWSVRAWNKLETWRAAHHLATDIYGATYPLEGRIQLSPFICEILAQVLNRSADQPLYTALGVSVLAHESAHASGIAAENKAECHAIETDARTARLLGLSKSAAAELPHIYRGSIYPYDAVQYRTPACQAGLPGAVIPDTLGPPAELRPLERMGAAVAKSLSGWKSLGGIGHLGPLSPCSPIRSRTTERLRFSVGFAGPGGESLIFSTVRFKKRAIYSQSRVGQAKAQRCDVALENRLDREEHVPGTYSAGHPPKAFARISPSVQAFREIWADGSQRWNRDSIFVFDPSVLGQTHLFFRVPSSTPISQEIRAVKAALRASR